MGDVRGVGFGLRLLHKILQEIGICVGLEGAAPKLTGYNVS